MKEAVINAYKNYETVVNTDTLNLYNDTDGSAIKRVMAEVINETPYLFYTGRQYYKKIVSSTEKIKSIQLTYSTEYLNNDGSVNVNKIKRTRKKLDTAVSTALKGVEPGMTNVEKALVLHDYIISNTAYNDNSAYDYRLTECGVLLNHKANCQGYALAYKVLLEKVGIESRLIVSESMRHMWNLVQIDGHWFHVDVTWDDPIDSNSKKDQYGLVRHEYFLSSSDKFKSEDHTGFKDSVATSKKYDNRYWKKITSAFQYSKGKWLFLNGKGIVQKDSITSGKAKVLKSVIGKSMVKLNDSRYYLIAYNSVYLYNEKTNSLRVVWRTESKFRVGYYLTQIKYLSGKVYYRVLRGKKHVSGSFNVKKNGLVAA